MLFTGLNLVLLFVSKVWKKQANENEQIGFFNDEPLNSQYANLTQNADEFGYANYARIISEKIEATHLNNSFAVGINGRWGTGKTSFLNLIKKNLKQENQIIIDFNPWSSSSPDAIIKDFFDTLYEEIKPAYASLANQLVVYSEKLTSVDVNPFLQSLRLSKTGFGLSNDSTKELYESINEQIKAIDQKIIVFIDDLDRLNTKEILEVIRLIRNTANFSNTVFIVAYDRNYVLTAIKDHNSYNHQHFLEKIFQTEINLPYFDAQILKKRLISNLSGLFPNHKSEIENALVGSVLNQAVNLENWVHSMRDVTRLSNSIALNFQKLQGEVYFPDFFSMELLRLKYPGVYELFYKRKSDFLTKDNTYTYMLLSLDKSPMSALESYLKTHATDLLINTGDIEKIIDLIQSVFPGNNLYLRTTKDHRAITIPSQFEKYFAYSLLNWNLSELEFTNARKEGLDTFCKKIDEWIEKGLELELKHRFEIIKEKDYDNREDFETIVTAIFYLANKETKRDTVSLLIGYDPDNLKEKVYNYNNTISNQYYAGIQPELKDFVHSLFKKAKSPFLFEREVIRRWLYNYREEESFLFSQKEIESIIIEYFSYFCSNSNKVNNDFLGLFYCCQSSDWISNGYGAYTRQEKYLEEAINLFIAFSETKDLNGVLKSIIEKEPFEKKLFTINNVVSKIWGSREKFKNFLSLQDPAKWSYLREFMCFFEACEKVNFEKYIAFDFKVIPIQDPEIE